MIAPTRTLSPLRPSHRDAFGSLRGLSHPLAQFIGFPPGEGLLAQLGLVFGTKGREFFLVSIWSLGTALLPIPVMIEGIASRLEPDIDDLVARRVQCALALRRDRVRLIGDLRQFDLAHSGTLQSWGGHIGIDRSG